MKLVNDWGSIYRLSDSAYRRFLDAGMLGKEPNARDYGTCLGSIAMSTMDAKPIDYEMANEMNNPADHSSKRP